VGLIIFVFRLMVEVQPAMKLCVCVCVQEGQGGHHLQVAPQ